MFVIPSMVTFVHAKSGLMKISSGVWCSSYLKLMLNDIDRMVIEAVEATVCSKL